MSEKRTHTCGVCGKVGTWNYRWQYYGTADLVALVTCSDKCRGRVVKPPKIVMRGGGYTLYHEVVAPAVIRREAAP